MNLFRADLEGDDDHRPGYHRLSRSVGGTIGGGRIGATLYELAEDERVCPYHSPHGVEEFLADTIAPPRMREIDGGRTTSVRRYIGVVKMRGVDHDLDYYPLIVEGGAFEIVSE